MSRFAQSEPFARPFRFFIRRSASSARPSRRRISLPGMRAKIAAHHSAVLRECSEQFAGAISDAFTCANCAHRPLYFDAAVSATGVAGSCARSSTISNTAGSFICAIFLPLVRETIHDPRLRDRRFDIIVPVPLHPARERERGFNQASCWRNYSARHFNSLQAALERIRYTTTQTAFDRAERMENLRDAFRLRQNADVQDLRVLLIDDILTTGSTLSECARVLKRAGAISVHAATAARA